VAVAVAIVTCGAAAQERVLRDWLSHHSLSALQNVMRTPSIEPQPAENLIRSEFSVDDPVGRNLSQPEVASREIGVFGSSAVVLELVRIGPDGRFVRPRILVGRNSPELKLWLHEAGLRAERCMLLMVWTRAKRDPESGKLGATVMLSARCTFY
jgi:hypothetical protein